MANQIPFSGASNAAGGYLLPPEQGEILTNGVLQEAGAIALAGDARATNSRRTTFPIWLGTPTAGAVGEGADKPVTGAEFGTTELNVKKFASIVLFTDEMIEDVQGGDLNVLVDSGVREAINDVIDANAIGKDSGTNISGVFDSMLRSPCSKRT
jgi:HK97 family phage major capsid protein